VPFGRDSHCSETDLSAYLDAQLAGAAQERCDAHLRACGGCRDALDGLGAVRSSLRELPRASAPRSFRLREAQVGRAQVRRWPLLVQAMPLLSGMSAVSLVVFIGLVSVNVSGGVKLGTSNDSKSSGASSLMSADRGTAADSALPEGSENAPVAPNALSGAPSGTLDTRQPEAATARNSEFFAADQAAGAAEATSTAARPPAPVAVSSDNGGDSDTAMHIAEAVAAALALGSGGLAFTAYRRTR